MDVHEMRAALGGDLERFPREAVIWARENWDAAAPVLLDSLRTGAEAAEPSDEDLNVACYALHLFAERRDGRAFPLVCAVARDGDRLEWILGDIVTEYFNQIIVGLCGSDAATLQAIVADGEGDEYVRSAFFDAWLWLAMSGDIPEVEAWAFLQTLPSRFRGQDVALLFHIWATAVIALRPDEGFALARDAFGRGWMDKTISRLSDYDSDRKQWRDDRDAERRRFLEENGPIDDALPVLERWMTPPSDEPSARSGWVPADGSPAENPYRDVGRNDPCPCGSGKKFKKCCLPLLDA